MNLCKIQTPCCPAPRVALLCSFPVEVTGIPKYEWLCLFPFTVCVAIHPKTHRLKTPIGLLYLERPRAGVPSRHTTGGFSLPLITGLCVTCALGEALGLGDASPFAYTASHPDQQCRSGSSGPPPMSWLKSCHICSVVASMSQVSPRGQV